MSDHSSAEISLDKVGNTLVGVEIPPPPPLLEEEEEEEYDGSSDLERERDFLDLKKFLGNFIAENLQKEKELKKKIDGRKEGRRNGGG